MEHYSSIRGWLTNIAHKVLTGAQYESLMNEINKMEVEGQKGEAVIKHFLGRLHELFTTPES